MRVVGQYARGCGGCHRRRSCACDVGGAGAWGAEEPVTCLAQHRWFCAEEESGVIPKLIVLFVFGNKLAARRTWHVCDMHPLL